VSLAYLQMLAATAGSGPRRAAGDQLSLIDRTGAQFPGSIPDVSAALRRACRDADTDTPRWRGIARWVL